MNLEEAPAAQATASARQAPISAFIVSMNEEDHIEACIRTLDFCDEIIVIDSHSTDRTREIAASLGARVIERDWKGYVDQKTFGLSQCSHDWVVHLDADERVSPELRASILRALSDPASAELAGFECNRVVFFLDRWWRRGGWYPEFRLRFFRRSAVKWSGTEPHEKVVALGPVARIEGELEHFSWDDLEDQLKKLHKYSTLSARALYQEGRRAGALQIIFSPLVRFLKFYLLKRGFREGMAGLIMALNEAFYTFMKYAKLWEMHFNAKSKVNASEEKRSPADQATAGR